MLAKQLRHLSQRIALGSLSEKRNLRATLSGGTSVIARGVQVATSLVTIPLVINHLGRERFGLWMTASSLLAMATFADFGIGNGVLNKVASAYGREDLDDIRRSVSSGFVLLLMVAALLVSCFLAVFSLVSWADLFRIVSPPARAEAGPTVAVFAACFALNLPLDLVQRVQLGLQQGFRMNLWQICGSVAGLVGVLISIKLRLSLPWLVVFLAGAPVFATGLNTLHYFLIVRADLSPKFRYISVSTICEIAQLGMLFFMLQIVVAIAFSADSLIVARTLGANTVPEYSVPQRMFSLISLLTAMIMAPFWPAYGEALARNDHTWTRRTLSASIRYVLLFSVLAVICLLVLTPAILRLWIGSQIHPSNWLLVGLAIWTVFDCCGNAIAMFFNGAGVVRYQIVTSVLFGIACITLKVSFITRFGLAAIPFATALSYLLFILIPAAFFLPRFLKVQPASGTVVSMADPVHTVVED